MKKNLFRLLACVMAFAMVLSLAACGGSPKSSGSSSASSAASSKVESSEASSKASSAPSEAESSSESSASSTAAGLTGEKFASVEEFLEDPTVKSMLETAMGSLDDSMNVDISGNGGKLVYTFTFSEPLEDVDAIKTALEEQMNGDDFAGTFRGIAASLKDAIEAQDPSVVVTYLNADGTEIYSQEYFPE